MTRAITILTENFADWETALINSTARLYYGFYTQFATPGGLPVTSSGGMLVTPQLALEDIALDGVDLLMVCGGRIWQSGKAPACWPRPACSTRYATRRIAPRTCGKQATRAPPCTRTCRGP